MSAPLPKLVPSHQQFIQEEYGEYSMAKDSSPSSKQPVQPKKIEQIKTMVDEQSPGLYRIRPITRRLRQAQDAPLIFRLSVSSEEEKTAVRNQLKLPPVKGAGTPAPKQEAKIQKKALTAMPTLVL